MWRSSSTNLRDDNKVITDELADHETRLRRLEATRWPLPTIGALAGVAGVATALFALLQH
ncbi:hypothetical protein OH779_19895 [Actinacidiphila glaucinigra]|uniref:hypothetical protein n=1 Tax=Actinacidiphila glaucinigra TaxID=235986 RepID=UPI003868A132